MPCSARQRFRYSCANAEARSASSWMVTILPAGRSDFRSSGPEPVNELARLAVDRLPPRADDDGEMNVRYLPWLIGVIGLTVPVVGSGFVGWQLVVVWLIGLSLAYAFTRSVIAAPQQKIVAAVLLLPVLLATAWEGGWWLIPADIVWLALALRQWLGDRAAAIGP